MAVEPHGARDDSACRVSLGFFVVAALLLAGPAMAEERWYRPPPDVTWQWQLQGDIDTRHAAVLYDVDLFETPASVIRALAAEGRRVICYFSAGSGENFRPDYHRLRPSELGRVLDGYADERWLDIRSANVARVMQARMDLAVARGCDGVEPDNVDGYENETGFAISAAEQLAFNRHLAREAHRRGLGIALKNDGRQARALVDDFDFALNEECHLYRQCGELQVFVERQKAVLNAEYALDRAEAEARREVLCAKARAEGFRTLILPLALDGSFRVACP